MTRFGSQRHSKKKNHIKLNVSALDRPMLEITLRF